MITQNIYKKNSSVPNILSKKSIYEEPLLNKSVVSMIGRLCPQKIYTFRSMFAKNFRSQKFENKNSRRENI